MGEKIKKHSLFIIIFVFLIFRVSFLTRLPIFNDEAIYLDWGWKALTIPGALFYSLIDGKQPLLMWLFGVFQFLFPDQLFAGRLVSVLFGLLTALGLFKIATKYFDKSVAIYSIALYVSIPIFSLFDRLALMESSISACGVWTIYLYLRYVDTKVRTYAFLVGLVLGVGFFIKSSTGIFILTLLSLFAYHWIKTRQSEFLKGSGLMATGFLTATFLLLLQPNFWGTLSMNERYSLTFTELLGLPIVNIGSNLVGNAEILFFFVTPVVVLGFLGITRCLMSDRARIILSLWLIISFILQTVLVRATTQRYLVSFLPLLCIFIAFFLFTQKKRLGIFFQPLCVMIVVLPLIFTGIQMVNPIFYTRLTQPLTRQTELGLITGQVSGYGVEEVVEKIDAQTRGENTFVATAVNIGNPESAMHVYFHKKRNVKVGYFDRQLFSDQLDQYDCITSRVPFFFVSRDEQQAGLNKYFEEIDRVRHPIDTYSLGLYTLKKNCKGTTITVDPFAL